jgi:hypothetical protein
VELIVAERECCPSQHSRWLPSPIWGQ